MAETSPIERALATLQDLLDNSIFTSRIDFALEVAIESLREKAEREKGCAFCNTRAHRILQNALYCPRCGKRLEVEHE
jgi:tRNA(Ile2) C34 agmatinyltransferase TiaS